MRGLSQSPIAPLSVWKRFAIVLLTVPAILVGLLAMHFLTTGAAHAPDAHGSTTHASIAVTGSAADNLAATPQTEADCDPACVPEHDMLDMACILALLMTALLLTVRLTLLRWGTLRARASTLLAQLANLAPPQPPSLLVLSISRT